LVVQFQFQFGQTSQRAVYLNVQPPQPRYVRARERQRSGKERPIPGYTHQPAQRHTQLLANAERRLSITAGRFAGAGLVRQETFGKLLQLGRVPVWHGLKTRREVGKAALEEEAVVVAGAREQEAAMAEVFMVSQEVEAREEDSQGHRPRPLS
jgi:hypothetical protein